jgi:hypothetical protein
MYADLRTIQGCSSDQHFRHLLTLADRAYLVVWVPGGPPPAEVALVHRLAELQPDARFHAGFDLDPAGIRSPDCSGTASGVTLAPTGMTPALFARARKRLPSNRWDEAQLERYSGDAAALDRQALGRPQAAATRRRRSSRVPCVNP